MQFVMSNVYRIGLSLWPYFRADIAVIGLAVMGQNLILNMNDHGYVVCAYNRTPDKVTNFLENEAKSTNVCNNKNMSKIYQRNPIKNFF